MRQPHGVIVGGFTESKGALERVAEAAVGLGMVHDAEDKVFTMRGALGRDEEKFRSAAKNGHVFVHSGGALALVGVEDLEAVTLVAAPKKRFVLRLGASAVHKTFNHLAGSTEHPRRDHLRVVAGNTYELGLHAFSNGRHIPKISQFSTIDALVTGQIQAEHIGYYPQADDEFFGGLKPIDTVTLAGLGHTISELPGRHDELLVDPAGTLSRIWALQGDAGEPAVA